jgi:O-acetyl-ADP-ribose deacetylase (regulator of RNase III)
MIEFRPGDLLASDAEALVNTVNCVGVMGKGIALQFKQAYPDNYDQYRRACRRGEVHPGRMFVVETNRPEPPNYIINFPTKCHWRGKSRLEDIRAGLAALVEEIRRRGIRSLALPPLGCGHGGLKLEQVYPLIEAALGPLENVQVQLYAPPAAAEPVSRPAPAKPKLTRGRALLLCLMNRYKECGYPLTPLAVQRLAYLLQQSGEKLGLRFAPKHARGPLATNLQPFLSGYEGHYFQTSHHDRRGSDIALVPGALVDAERFLADHPDARAALERIGRLIEGFETPVGLELLTSVHWASKQHLWAGADVGVAVDQLHVWSARKRKLFPPDQIAKAWQRLKQEDWFPVARSA